MLFAYEYAILSTSSHTSEVKVHIIKLCLINLLLRNACVECVFYARSYLLLLFRFRLLLCLQQVSSSSKELRFKLNKTKEHIECICTGKISSHHSCSYIIFLINYILITWFILPGSFGVFALSNSILLVVGELDAMVSLFILL